MRYKIYLETQTERKKTGFRKIKPYILDRIDKLQCMKNLPIGAIGKRDVRINRLIHKLFQRKEI